MTNTDITVYGAHWCPDCRVSKQFLGEHQIPYNWIDIEEDPEGEKFVIEKNDGPFYKGKQVAVVGGGNSATEESLLLTKFADQVTILVRSDNFKASAVIQEKVRSHPKIEVRWNTEVKEFIGRESKLTEDVSLRSVVSKNDRIP
jgi:thioredoxin reductase